MKDPTPESGRARWIRRVLATVVVVASFGFLGYQLSSSGQHVHALTLEFKPAYLCAAAGAFAAYDLLLIGGILLLVRNIAGRQITFTRAARVFAFPQITKYLPGRIAMYVTKYHMLDREGLDRQQNLYLIFLETYLLVAACCVVGAFHASAFLREIGALLLAAFILLAVGLVFLRKGTMTWIFRVFLKSEFRVDLRPRFLMFMLGYNLVVVLGAVTSLYFVILSFLPASDVSYSVVITSHCLSFVAGAVIFVVPAGLGVRDNALAALLQGTLVRADAIVAALLFRLASILNDLLTFGAIMVWTRLRRDR